MGALRESQQLYDLYEKDADFFDGNDEDELELYWGDWGGMDDEGDDRVNEMEPHGNGGYPSGLGQTDVLGTAASASKASGSASSGANASSSQAASSSSSRAPPVAEQED